MMDYCDKLEREDCSDFNVADADVYIRLGFIRKVYSILSVQLLITSLTSGMMMFFKEHIALSLENNPILLPLFFFGTIILLIAMHFKRYVSPLNLILLFSFTFVEATLIGLTVVHFKATIVLSAFLITMVVLFGLTMYTIQSKKDFHSWGMPLGVLLICLITGGLINLMIGSSALELLLSMGGALLFSALIVYDTQLMMQRFSPEEYIPAAITLYLDIINLFLHILRLLNATSQSGDVSYV